MESINTLQKIIDAHLPNAERGDIEAANLVLRALELQAKIQCGAL